MNKTIQRLLWGSLLLTLSACGGGGGGGGGSDDRQVDINDPDEVMEALSVKVGGAEGVRSPGNLPPASSDDLAPKLTSGAEVSSSNGATAQIPLNFEANSAIAALFIKVVGSDSVFSVDVSGQTAQKAMAEQALAKGQRKIAPNGAANFQVTLPAGLTSGRFTVEIACQDADGRISERSLTEVAVAEVGTGDLQFSLSWDAEVDLDLYVIEPDGNQIFFANPGPSATGGQLDFDDTDGTGTGDVRSDGLNALENIFWQDSAPRGEYRVGVDHYIDDFDEVCGNETPTNFTVTISQGGVTVDTVSVNNFRGNENCGPVLVYTLNN